MNYIWMMHGMKADWDEYTIATRASTAPGPGGNAANMPNKVRQVLGTHGDLGF